MRLQNNAYIVPDNGIFLFNPAWLSEWAMPGLAVRLWFYSQDRFGSSDIHLIPMHHYTGQEIAMSRKPKQKQEKAQADFIGFVNIRLTDEELIEVDNALNSDNPPSLEENLETLLDTGKVSLNYLRGTLNVTLVVLEGEMSGYAVSAYGTSPLETTAILRYKVVKYLKDFKTLYESGGNTRQRG